MWMTDQTFIMETKWLWMLKKCAYVVISAEVSQVIMHVNYAALPEDQTIWLAAAKQTFKWQFYTFAALIESVNRMVTCAKQMFKSQSSTLQSNVGKIKRDMTIALWRRVCSFFGSMTKLASLQLKRKRASIITSLLNTDHKLLYNYIKSMANYGLGNKWSLKVTIHSTTLNKFKH